MIINPPFIIQPPPVQPYSPLDEGTPTAWLRPEMACSRGYPGTIGSAMVVTDGWGVFDGTTNGSFNQAYSTDANIAARWVLGTKNWKWETDVIFDGTQSGYYAIAYADGDNTLRFRYTATSQICTCTVGGVTVANYQFNWSPNLGQIYHMEWERVGGDMFFRIDKVAKAATAIVGITAATDMGDKGFGGYYRVGIYSTAYMYGRMRYHRWVVDGNLIVDYPMTVDLSSNVPAFDPAVAPLWHNYDRTKYINQDTTHANRPTWDADGLGAGLPGLVFDDSDLLQAPASTGGIKCAMPCTMFMVFKWVDGETTSPVVLFRGDNAYIAYRPADDMPLLYAGTTRVSAVALTGNVQVLVARLQSGSGELWQDGVKTVNADIGSGTTASTTFAQGTGIHGDRLLFSRALTDAEILRVLNYLQAKYGLAISAALT
jgi:hypothetical protein